ncbi:MAG: ABC transporter ATP-binding protein [Gallicola sp.]|nr:ABC transporter ATP-binding protein [Gallicola sp.]
MIEVTNLSKKYPKSEKFSLDKAEFTLNKGEMVGLIGANGAGKSTLMKTMCKFIGPTTGKVFLNGVNIFESDYQLRDVGILLEPVFFPQLTAYENLEYYLKIHDKKEFLNTIEDHLEMVGLMASKDQKVKGFSFGMKQRLGLAMALLGKPKLLILDEPFVGLDPNGMKDLIDILQKRVQEENITALVSSHQLHELSAVCERVIVIQDGVIVFDGVPDNSPQITIELDREFVPSEGFQGEVFGRKITTSVNGEDLSMLMERLSRDYKILSVDSKQSALEKFF